ncbi:NAD(P)H-dependent oxidoreductase [Streptomyces sp. ISL-96]|uniref:NADPH-dependent FMN reductase n=1 Tax=Streptomyces sp. ISL-96 TaxID=2819191 RepID=UPI001BE68FAC|nr:NAD(P)H-dependent oxidoreductase [Streptomyces sp. ISL-96]MBT2488419.1 NAD(P)H-dependent oxidoreductase [Streptomyces sp. ISL-96]
MWPGEMKPLVVGIGGTGRPGSTTDKALALALRGAREAGARTRLFDAGTLGVLPLFQPQRKERGETTIALLDALARADGVLLASPSYHGGVSGLVKNALDYLEDLRDDPRPYLDGRAVGCVVTAAGWQSAGTTLCALRSIVHALRGWPTPLGVALNTTEHPLAPTGMETGDRFETQLLTVGRQVTEFAMAFGGSSEAMAGVTG